MQIIGAFDVHRKQITFKWLNTGTGEVGRGRITPALREKVREFLGPFKGLDAHFALEATTGWRFVAEEVSRAGLTTHLAEPAETATLRGTKRRAKTDRLDCDHIVDLLGSGRLPESWIPPEHVLEIRTLVRLRKALTDEHREWQQRLQAQLFHQGVQNIRVTDTQGREQLAEATLSVAGRKVITTGLEVIDHLIASSHRLTRISYASLGSNQAAGPSSSVCSELATSLRCLSGPSSGTVGDFPPPTMRCGTPGSMSPSTSQLTSGLRDISLVRVLKRSGGLCTKSPSPPRVAPPRIVPITLRSRSASTTSGPVCRWPVRSAGVLITSCAASGQKPSHPWT